MSTFDELFKSDIDIYEMNIGLNQKNQPVVLYISEAGSKKHKKAQRKYSKALEAARRSEKKRNQIWARICAESVLEDWKGFLDDDGNVIEATLENKVKFLSDYEKFLADVLNAASESSNFKIAAEDAEDEDDEDDEDNSDVTPQEDTEKN